MIKDKNSIKVKIEPELKSILDFENFFIQNEGKDLFPAKTEKVKRIYQEIKKVSV